MWTTSKTLPHFLMRVSWTSLAIVQMGLRDICRALYLYCLVSDGHLVNVSLLSMD